jgi:hypothetical protein
MSTATEGTLRECLITTSLLGIISVSLTVFAVLSGKNRTYLFPASFCSFQATLVLCGAGIQVAALHKVSSDKTEICLFITRKKKN